MVWAVAVARRTISCLGWSIQRQNVYSKLPSKTAIHLSSSPTAAPTAMTASPPTSSKDIATEDKVVSYLNNNYNNITDIFLDDLSELPLLPDPTTNPEYEGTRKIRHQWPVALQHFMRDKSIFRFIIDSITYIEGRSVFKQYPGSWKTFLQLSGAPLFLEKMLTSQTDETATTRYSGLRTIQYGSHSMQRLHLWDQHDDRTTPDRTLVFVHGGAWGTGFPAMYRLIAAPWLDRGFRVAIVGYRTYPDADVEGQVDDVVASLHKMRELHPNTTTLLMGHSTGAHIGALAVLRKDLPQRINIESFVGVSGVYDIPAHHIYECGRGVDQISPLIPANGHTEDNWKACSPTWILRGHQKKLDRAIGHGSGGGGDTGSTVVDTTSKFRYADTGSSSSSSSSRYTQREIVTDGNTGQNQLDTNADGSRQLPRMYTIHGGRDTVVPYAATIDFANALKDQHKGRNDIQGYIMNEAEHSETVIESMMGGPTQDLIFDLVLPKSSS